MKSYRNILVLLMGLLFCMSCTRVGGNKKPANYAEQKTERKSARSRQVNNEPSTSATEPIEEVPVNKSIVSTSANDKVLNGSEIFERYESAVFMIFTSDGKQHYQGSGFFINEDGVGVSNYHVFKGSAVGEEVVKLSNNKQYKVKRVIAKDSDLDFIVFEIKKENEKFNYIPIDKNKPRVGERVYAIGSPHGLENTFSSGEISQIRDDFLYQISVPIDHGSSGGALINEKGKVIGITTGGLGESGANLNFAVSIKAIDKLY